MIGKMITCMQTGKALVLVIGRLVQHFDISLPEAVTIPCITLTLLSCGFWFRKPYEIAVHQELEVPADLEPTKEENGDWN